MSAILNIIIPTKNREEILYTTISKAIIAIQNEPIEIIVINDGEELENKIIHPSVQYFNNPKQGVCSARNFGAQNSSASTLLFLDDDMWITSQTILAIKEIIEKRLLITSVVCLNWEYPEQLCTQLEHNKIGRYFIAYQFHNLLGRSKTRIENQNDRLVPTDGIGSASLLIATSVFYKIGTYNEKIQFQGEDIDLYNKLKQHNISIHISKDILCYHNDSISTTIDAFLYRQIVGYASQAQAEYKNLIATSNYTKTLKYKIYKNSRFIEPLLKLLYKLIPNKKVFDKISFRLIGILSSIQKAKAYQSKTK